MKLKHLQFGLFVGFLTVISNCFSQSETGSPEEGVKWMTFEQAVEKSKIEKRKIIIDVYTDWCGWCKVMDKKTFPDPLIAKLLNEKFYAVKLDAEQMEDIHFNGHTFKFVPMGSKGVHQLAAALLNNQMSYPNLVFLDEEFRIVPIYQGYTSLPGYRKPDEFHLFLTFVSGNFFQRMNINEYQREYKSPYTNVEPPASPAKN